MTESAKEKRAKIIKIRVSPDEEATLKMHCTKPRLAEWMRETCLAGGGQADWVEQSKGPAPIDPELLRQLSGIGNNLNQLARAAHAKLDPATAIKLVSALTGIERELKELRDSMK